MKRGPRYIALVVATIALIIVVIASSVVVSKRNDLKSEPADMESESLFSSRGTMEPTLSPQITSNPTNVPSLTPSIGPEQNWTYPSQKPTIEGNDTETFFPTNFTASPVPTDNSTVWPSFAPSLLTNSSIVPSLSPVPTYWNDTLPSEEPTSSFPSMVLVATGSPSTSAIDKSLRPSPAGNVTTMPGWLTTESPTGSATMSSRITTVNVSGSNLDTRFYAIGDVPYTRQEANALKVQIANIPHDAEFVIHVGDIRTAKDSKPCTLQEYHSVAAILNQSHAPVFIVLGDNEWNDCPNVNQGFSYWMTVFGRFDEQWNHTFSLQRHATRPENFAFVHKRTLFFGLNLVGGRVQRAKEWQERLTDLYQWVQQLVDSRVLSSQADADSVVIFGHAHPTRNHAAFFNPLSAYLMQDLVSRIPFLYLNGDGHAWNYTENFYRRPNFLRIQVEGGIRDPPLQISLNNSAARVKPVSQVFNYNRMKTTIQI